MVSSLAQPAESGAGCIDFSRTASRPSTVSTVEAEEEEEEEEEEGKGLYIPHRWASCAQGARLHRLFFSLEGVYVWRVVNAGCVFFTAACRANSGGRCCRVAVSVTWQDRLSKRFAANDNDLEGIGEGGPGVDRGHPEGIEEFWVRAAEPAGRRMMMPLIQGSALWKHDRHCPRRSFFLRQGFRFYFLQGRTDMAHTPRTCRGEERQGQESVTEADGALRVEISLNQVG